MGDPQNPPVAQIPVFPKDLVFQSLFCVLYLLSVQELPYPLSLFNCVEFGHGVAKGPSFRPCVPHVPYRLPADNIVWLVSSPLDESPHG